MQMGQRSPNTIFSDLLATIAYSQSIKYCPET